MAPYAIGYVWNAKAGRFIGPGGQFVSLSTVRSTLDVALDAAARDAAEIAAAYSAGSIGVSEFERQMQQLITDTQIYAAGVSAGGFSQMGISELQLLTQRIGEQFAYLRGWAEQLDQGVQGSEKALASRARMYAQSARNTFDVNYKTGQLIRGFNEERNILNPGESCELCIAQTELGWVPIGTLIPVGERTCLSNCNCETEYRFSRETAAEEAAA